MIRVPSDLFMLSNEAVVMCRCGAVVFANSAARGILGQDCVGRSCQSLFGSEICESQVSSFVVDARINDREYILRVSRNEGVQTVFFSPQADIPMVLNDAFICSLRSHLMNIGIAVDLARECSGEVSEDGKLLDCVSSLRRSYYGIYRLINNATAVREINDGELPFIPSRINISRLCSELVDTVRDMRPGCEFRADTGADIMLCADPSLVKLLLLNLLSNCLLHAKGMTRLSVSLIDSLGSVILSVSDDGCGIAQDELCSVFDRYRHSFSILNIGSGAGFGLTIARGIASAHGGTLVLESREGRGTTVRASFRKDIAASLCARSVQTAYDNSCEDIRIDLAECLPPESYDD